MMVDIWQQLQSFMGRGGHVLWVILALLVLMWILMIERLLYLNLGFGPLQRQLFGRWQGRSERHSWHAKAIRSRWLAEADATVLIHGHTHRPGDHALGADARGRPLAQVVLSDWHVTATERRLEVLRLTAEGGLQRVSPGPT